MTIIVLAAMLGLIPGGIAASRGHSFLLWWLYGALIFIVAFPHSLFLRRTQASLDREARDSGQVKCLHCAEWIRRDAKACRHCGREVDVEARRAAASAAAASRASRSPALNKTNTLLLYVTGGVGLLFVAFLVHAALTASGGRSSGPAVGFASCDEAWADEFVSAAERHGLVSSSEVLNGAMVIHVDGPSYRGLTSGAREQLALAYHCRAGARVTSGVIVRVAGLGGQRLDQRSEVGLAQLREQYAAQGWARQQATPSP